MTPQRYQRVRELYHAVCELSPADRDDHLSRACEGDSELRAVVESLLRTSEDGEDAFSESKLGIGRAITDAALKSAPPTESEFVIGGYRTLRKIGEGGMGAVYEARQQNPQRVVALKIIRPGFGTPNVLRRFQLEAEVLARLNHPGIAHIYEAGVATTPFGPQPYFAMELIDGQPLNSYVRTTGLTMHDRLRLVVKVAEAVNHAHQKGVIHRDLKPGNILVDRSGRPKILDFGIARATDADLRATTIQTGAGQLIGTIPYMSPEQISGSPEELDTRSDVYALGVLLYEALTGKLPYDLSGKSVPEAALMIRETDPARISSIDRLYRGDIEAIVAKALAKDKDRRYESAAALALDIRRFLADEPIEAKRDSALYLLRKNAKRYRGGLTAAATFVLLLAAFSIWAISQTRVQTRLAEEAGRARDRATETSIRLTAEMSQNNIERGRALAAAGNYGDSERLLWRELLQQPESQSTLWALRELYSRNANQLTMHTQIPTISGIAISPDETRLAAGGDGDQIEIWDLQEQKRVATLPSAKIVAGELEYSPDGTLLKSVGADGKITIWNCATASPRRIFEDTDTLTTTACFSPTGKQVFSSGADGLIRVREIATGDCTHVIDSKTSGLTRVRVSPCGRFVAAGALNGEVIIWDTASILADDRPMPRSTFGKHRDRVTCVTFSSDGRLVASAGWTRDRTIKIWNLETNACDVTFEQLTGAKTTMVFSADSRTLYSDGWFSVDAWDLATRKHAGSIYRKRSIHVALSKDDRRLFAGCLQDIRVWDVTPTPAFLQLGPRSGRSVVYHPQGRWLATSREDGAVQLRNPETGEVQREFAPEGAPFLPDDSLYRIRSLCFNRSGDEVFSVDRDHNLRRWDIATGRCVGTINKVNNIAAQSVAFSPDGRRWAYAQANTPLFHLCLVGSDSPYKSVSSDSAEALSICFSPDGRTIATSSRENAVRLWSIDGTPLARLECKYTPWGLAFSPDGSKVLAGNWDFTIGIWDVRAHTHDRDLEGHTATVWGVEFRPGDPDVFASCSSDGTVRLWSMSSARNLATFDFCPGEECIAASFSPDGRRIAATCANNEVRILDLEFLELCIAGNLASQRNHIRRVGASQLAESNPDGSPQAPTKPGRDLP
jgi:WD40 repeat protein